MNYFSKNDIARHSGTHVMHVSPKLAEFWLTLNTTNRTVSSGTVYQYAKRMTAGQWALTGQPIIFGSDGSLLNGQHRLHAVIKAESGPMPFDVKFGVNPAYFALMDEVLGRTAGNVFDIAQVPNYNRAASTVAMVMGLEISSAHKGFSTKNRPSNSDVLERYYQEEEVFKYWISLGTSWYNESGRLMPPSTWSAYGYMMSKTDEHKALGFLNQLASGAGLEKGSAVLLLRNALISAKADKSKRYKHSYMRALVLKAWRFYRNGRAVKVLKYDTVNEQYPTF